MAGRASLRRFGNLSEIIIPKSLLAEAGIAVGDKVEMRLEQGCIMFLPLSRASACGLGRGFGEDCRGR
jgi:antitoxin component of MazEF toxin-antitoxin module